MLKAFLPKLPSITKRHIERQVLKTNPKHLLKIINDVNKYSEFLPFCSHSQILQRSNCGKHYDATLTIGFGPLFTENYISRVKVDERNMIVETESIQSSTFDSLKSKWTLSDYSVPNIASLSSVEDDHDKKNKWCNVEFEVEISVNDPIISNVLDSVLDGVAKQQMEAFQIRCKAISSN